MGNNVIITTFVCFEVGVVGGDFFAAVELFFWSAIIDHSRVVVAYYLVGVEEFDLIDFVLLDVEV